MKNSLKHLFAWTAIAVVGSIVTTQSQADPIPGRDLIKFEQKPMINTTITNTVGTPVVYHGHDEISTAYGIGTAAQPPTDYQGTFMADDFADNYNSPIVHVKWYGSYHNNSANQQIPVQKFLIAIEDDVPQIPGTTFSTPGALRQYDIVTPGAITPGSGTFTEKLVGGPDIFGDMIYEYNAELHATNAFQEQAGVVYWLKIAALVDLPPNSPIPPIPTPTLTQWGWHNRDYTQANPYASAVPAPGENVLGQVDGVNVNHFQDDAVQGNIRFLPLNPPGAQMFQTNMLPQDYIDFADGPGPNGPVIGIGGYSKDLAFTLYTLQNIPEPASCLLMAIGLAGVFATRRRSRTA